MLAIHLFILTIEEHYMVSGDINKVLCNNLGAIYTFKRPSQRVTSRAKNADVQRVLRQIQGLMTSTRDSKHVCAHQDESKLRSALSIESQLNCRCDDLAKAAVCEAMTEVAGPSQEYILPLENICVFIDDVKQTTDVAEDLRFHIGRQSARKLYAKLNIIDNDTFVSVAWETKVSLSMMLSCVLA